MTLYCRIINNVLTMELTTSVSVSDKAQKNLGESTDPIGKTDQYRLWYNIGKGACLKWEDVALVVGLYKVQIGHVEQTLGRGHFPDSLKDAVKGAPKLHGLRRNLYVCGVFDNGHPLVELCRYIGDEAWSEVIMGGHFNTGRTSEACPQTPGLSLSLGRG